MGSGLMPFVLRCIGGKYLKGVGINATLEQDLQHARVYNKVGNAKNSARHNKQWVLEPLEVFLTISASK